MSCTTRSMASLTWSRMAAKGISTSLIEASVSSRDKASYVLLACTVDSDPSWPVFMACSMSRASPPRTSPTMIRSGRIRRELRTRSRMVIEPLPSAFGGRVSSRTTCSWPRESSAASSTVTIRSRAGTNWDSALSRVVFPDDVPPDTTMLTRARTQAASSSADALSRVPRCSSSLRPYALGNSRMVTDGPLSDSGGSTTLTRAPRGSRASAGSRASTIGLDSSTRRLTADTIRSMVCSSWASEVKPDGIRSTRPNRSM